jgi:hypothetical protein
MERITGDEIHYQNKKNEKGAFAMPAGITSILSTL